MSLQYVYFPLRQYKLYCEGVNGFYQILPLSRIGRRYSAFCC